MYLTELIHDDNLLDELYNELINFIEINEINNCLSRVTTRRYQTLEGFFLDVSTICHHLRIFALTSDVSF